MNLPESLIAQVIELVKQIPHGKVMSYGQIAAKLGLEDARIIGFALHAGGSARDVPWWRVMRNDGKITIKDETLRLKQKELLEAEGVQVNENFFLDIDRYRCGEVSGPKRLF